MPHDGITLADSPPNAVTQTLRAPLLALAVVLAILNLLNLHALEQWQGSIGSGTLVFHPLVVVHDIRDPLHFTFDPQEEL